MFPNDFLWGAANAAYQVEGGIEQNNWVDWEKERAERKAQQYTKELQGSRFWPAVSDDVTDPESYITGQAVDHYNRYEEDFDIAASLNHNAHRLSLAWERIMPSRGTVDEDAVAHYHDVLDALHERDIEPIVTLWHFSHPQWFEEDGGWLSGDTTVFDEYAEFAIEEFGDKVSYWITLNEPQVFAGHAYGVQAFPPGHTNPWHYWKAERRLLDAHRRAYRRMTAVDPDAAVGLTVNLTHFDGPSNPLSRAAVRVGDYVFNDRVMDYAMPSMDFIGLNCYFYRWMWPTKPALTSVDEALYPRPASAVGPVLRRTWDRYDLPIIITENGVRDPTDEYRWDYTKRVLRQVHDAAQDGVDVRGYLHWALLDNYAWQEGIWPRMGLVEVNRETYERTVRDSAKRLARVYRTNERP